MRPNNVAAKLVAVVGLILISSCNSSTATKAPPVVTTSDSPALATANPLLPNGSFDIAKLKRQAHFAYRVQPAGGFSGGHSTYSVKVNDNGSFQFQSIKQKTPTSAVALKSGTVAAEQWHRSMRERIKGAPASFATVRIGNTVASAKPQLANDGRIILKRGSVVETLHNSESGVEQTWTFNERPAGSDDLIVRVAVSGHEYTGATTNGLHFIDRQSGLGLRYGWATWVDAKGKKTDITPKFDGSQIVLRVPAALVRQSSYPAVLDPTISGETGTDAPIQQATDAFILEDSQMGFDGTNYLVTWQDFRDDSHGAIWGAHVTPSGSIVEANGFVIGHESAFDAFGEGAIACETASPNNCLVVWLAEDDNFVESIHGQLVTPAGGLSGGTIVISNTGIYGGTFNPTVAFNGTNFLATWNERDVTPQSVRGAHISTSGSVLDSVTSGILIAADAQDPHVASDGAGNFLVVYSGPLASSIFAVAVGSSGGGGTPVTVNAGTAATPVAAWNGSNYVVAWTDYRLSTNRDIWSRTVSTGLALGGQVQLTNNAANEDTPAIACHGGTCMVAYLDDRNAGTGFTSDIFATPVSAPLTEAQLTTGSLAANDMMGLASDGTHFALAYTVNAGNNLDEIKVLGINDNGSSQFAEKLLSQSANNQASPASAFDGTHYLVVWADNRTVPNGSNIYGVLIANDGTLASAVFPVSPLTGQSNNPSVAFNGTNYVVVWEDFNNGIIASAVDTSGAVSHTGTTIITNGTQGVSGPGVASDGSAFFVTYAIGSSDAFPSSVHAQKFNGSLTAVGSDIDVFDSVTGVDGMNPRAAYDGTNYLVAFIDWGSTGNRVITTQRVNASTGALVGSSLIVSTTGVDQDPEQSVTYDGTNFVVAWNDARATTTFGFGEIYAARVSTAGALLDASGVGIATGSPKSHPRVLWDGSNDVFVWTDTENDNLRIARYTTSLVATGASLSISTGGSFTGASLATDKLGRTLVSYSQFETAPGLTETVPDNAFRVRGVFFTNLKNGQSCSGASSCASNNCVTGICCNNACPVGGLNVVSTTCNGTTPGICQIICSPGFGDCDNNPATGCEAATNTNTNCGGCGIACAPPNATGSCSTGSCAIVSCNSGFANCNGTVGDGCEVPTTTTANCGGCGTATGDNTHICSTNNLTGSICSTGVCGGTCNAGFGDCNANKTVAGNGCEAQLDRAQTDSPAGVPISGYTPGGITNCGACGVAGTCADVTARAAHKTHLCVPLGGGAAACRSFDRAQCATARCSGGGYVAPPGETVANLSADQDPNDVDADNLPDAWEGSTTNPYSLAPNPRGVDIDCDGKIDGSDFQFPLSDLPTVGTKDVYLRIRAMKQNTGTGAACANDATCQSTPACTRPLCDTASTHKCWNGVSRLGLTTACGNNTDCALGCPLPYCDTVAGKCSNDPSTGHAPNSNVIAMVQAAYAAAPHNIALHVDYDSSPGALLPHATNMSFFPGDVCDGSGTSVLPDADYFTNLKPLFADSKSQYVYRYVIFGHNWCFQPGRSGNSEILGNDSSITLGTSAFPIQDAIAQKVWQAGTLMHEIGHSMSLQHQAPVTNPPHAPNFMSVMNYRYQFSGISQTQAPFAAVPPAVAANTQRIDYSNSPLGTLLEATLNENSGVGASTNDIVTFNCPVGCTGAGCNNIGWAGGAIDWNCNMAATDNPVGVPIDGDNIVAGDTLLGREDWSTLQYNFQCDPSFANGALLPANRTTQNQNEASVQDAINRHEAYPPIGVNIDVRYGCATNFVTPGAPFSVPVTLFGSSTFSIGNVDNSSLAFAGSPALSSTVADVNGDGFADETILFSMAGMHLSSSATAAALSGSLYSSQFFQGKDMVTIAPSAGPGVTIKNDGSGYSISLRHEHEDAFATYSLSDCVTSVADRCGVPLVINSAGSIVRITSDEADQSGRDHADDDDDEDADHDHCSHSHGPRSGDDMTILSNSSFSVEKDRNGSGNGRVYTVIFNITDSYGDVTTSQCQIQVRHDSSGANAVDSGVHACTGSGC